MTDDPQDWHREIYRFRGGDGLFYDVVVLRDTTGLIRGTVGEAFPADGIHVNAGLAAHLNPFVNP